MKKRGQLQLSFGMIFSIILVITFIAFAIYVVMKFLDFQDEIKIKNFQEGLQKSINELQQGHQGKNVVSYNLPTKIEKICFFERVGTAKGKDKAIHEELVYISLDQNLIFYPEKSAGGTIGLELENLDIKNTTATDNPLCIENINGKVTINLKMDYGEKFITASR